MFLCVCRGCPRGGGWGGPTKNHQNHQNKQKQPKPPKPSTTSNSDGNQRKCRWGSQEMASASASASATASACPRAQGAMGTLREPCRGGSNGNQRKMVRVQNHQKLPKTTKATKTNKNHQNLVEMKRNGKPPKSGGNGRGWVSRKHYHKLPKPRKTTKNYKTQPKPPTLLKTTKI